METLSAQLASSDPPLVVDVRGPDEVIGPLGHMAGAVNVPLPELEAHIPEQARGQRPLVAVCKTDRRSSAAAEQLLAAGAASVAVLRGGMARSRTLGLN